MIWRWLTCFSFTVTGLHGAVVSGQVSLRDSRVDAVKRHRDYSGIVISLQPVNQAPPTGPAKHAAMIQKNKTFTPHVLPIEVGAVVDFPNFDPIFHNAFSSYSGQIFDIGLYPPGGSRSVRFARPGVVRVFCNIHPTMSAVILVLGSPYFTTTGKEGAFHMDVPAGAYDLSVFHERATEQTLQSLSQRVLVNGDSLRIQPIVVSEAGYLMAPHKNKYGGEYGPPPDDKVLYPGARN
jgi:plastocyanin